MKENPPEFELGKKHNIKKDAQIFNKHDTPAIILHNPKYPHNVGTIVRAASCFNSNLILFTGDRVSLEADGTNGYRLPREERMRDYKEVRVINDQYPFNRFSKDIVPVAVEWRQNAEQLPYFIHPENAVYVFGPEDGSIPQVMLQHCQRFVIIPSNHCVNLAMAVGLILYDRVSKQLLNTL